MIIAQEIKTTYFITATNTNIGKTKACEILIKKLSKKGFKVGYFKPIETGVIKYPEDGMKMLKLVKKFNKNFEVTINDVVGYKFKLPASVFVANKKKITIDINYLKMKRNYLLKFCDILIIEGAGGLMVPIRKKYFLIDLIKDFQNDSVNQKTILITPSKLGCINDTLLSIHILKQYKINFKWYVNLYKKKRSFKKITLPFYKEYFDNKINYL